jgi:hypothetical protein
MPPPETAPAPRKRFPTLAIVAVVALVAILATVGIIWGRDLWSLLPIAGRPSPTVPATATSPVAFNPSPSATPTGVPTRQTMATQPATITIAPRPTPSSTAVSPTATPSTVTPSPTATMGPITYDLLLVRRSNESLFVLNTGAVSFPLQRLRLNKGKDALEGNEWGLTMLRSGHCVAVWNDKGNPRPPEDVDCEPDPGSARLTREGKEIFWEDDKGFPIYFDDSEMATCFPQNEDRCNVHMVIGEQPQAARLFLPLISVRK